MGTPVARGRPRYREEPDVIAVLTMIVCLVASPDVCAVTEAVVSAEACRLARARLVAELLPDGYQVQRVRCAPRAWIAGPANVA
jgi:hypothetical protein